MAEESERKGAMNTSGIESNCTKKRKIPARQNLPLLLAAPVRVMRGDRLMSLPGLEEAGAALLRDVVGEPEDGVAGRNTIIEAAQKHDLLFRRTIVVAAEPVEAGSGSSLVLVGLELRLDGAVATVPLSVVGILVLSQEHRRHLDGHDDAGRRLLGLSRCRRRLLLLRLLLPGSEEMEAWKKRAI